MLFGRELFQMVHHGLKGAGAIVVVRIDDGKGLMDQVLGRQNGLHRTQGLGALSGDGAARRQVVQFLEGVFHFHTALDHIAHQLAEAVLKVMLNDKHDLVEACLHGIVDGVEHQHLVVGAHAVNLLISAVARAHAGGHDHEGFIHADQSFLPYLFMLDPSCGGEKLAYNAVRKGCLPLPLLEGFFLP